MYSYAFQNTIVFDIVHMVMSLTNMDVKHAFANLSLFVHRFSSVSNFVLMDLPLIKMAVEYVLAKKYRYAFHYSVLDTVLMALSLRSMVVHHALVNRHVQKLLAH